MTRKTKKGIVGKGVNTPTERHGVGTGINFKDEDVAYSDEIEQVIENKKKS